jgi:L,D-transpeptidase YcbB
MPAAIGLAAGIGLLAFGACSAWAAEESRPAGPDAARPEAQMRGSMPPAGPGMAGFAVPLPPDAPVAFNDRDRVGAVLLSLLSDAKLDFETRLGKAEREAIAAFYALGGFKPIWIAENRWSPAAQSVIATLKKAAEDGLDTDRYRPPAITPGSGPAELARADLGLSAAAVLYARDARGARIVPSRLSRLITPTLELPAGDAVLTQLASSQDAGAALAAYNPPHPGYRALKAKLAEIRAREPGSRLEADLLANMERWRWLPAEMGRRHVWVNIPEYKLRLLDNGRVTHEARVIVGKPESPTPIFSQAMSHAIVNPSWYVPPSIFRNEFHSSAAYAAARGYIVRRTKDGGISVRQPPGERNALGFIKFMFPNQHAVYLHDTPNRGLFGQERRAFSHGCVRLDQPFRFGDFVLGEEWTEARLKSLIGKGERTIHLPEKISVHITYFTVFVDEKGQVRQVADLYGANNKVRLALGLSSDGTRIAEAKPRKQAAPRTQATPRVQVARRTQVASRAQPIRRRPSWHARTVRGPMYADPFYYWWVTR